MNINLEVIYADKTTKELVANAADLVAFETKFDISIAKLEKEIRWTHICFLGWHVEQRTGGTKLDFEGWLEKIESVNFADSKK
jgi:hypothetical protein